jgi:Flp pilus assembly pilin Flp
MSKLIKEFLREESGLELAEYVIAAALIGLAVIVAFTNLGSSIVDTLLALIGIIPSS